MEMITDYENCLIELWAEPTHQQQPEKFNPPKMAPLPPKPQNNLSRQPTNLPYNIPQSKNNILQPNNRSENAKN
jgi:hypothetical protein